jgi:CheY-like chemotaxis protein
MRDLQPDEMLTDVGMPRRDGFDLRRNVRSDERLKEVPITRITPRTADRHREHARELGVDVFLGKPCEEFAQLRDLHAPARCSMMPLKSNWLYDGNAVRSLNRGHASPFLKATRHQTRRS